MDRMIYLAMSGAKALTQRQEALTNNLANASTTGFRADMMTFRSVPVNAESAASTRVFALAPLLPGPGPARRAHLQAHALLPRRRLADQAGRRRGAPGARLRKQCVGRRRR